MSIDNNFAKTTLSKAINDTQREIELSPIWNVGKIPNGGYLMAYAAKTMAEHLDHPHPLTVTAYYLDKSDVDTAIIESEVLRKGKSISTISGKLIQDGSERVRLTAAFTDFNYVKGESHCEETAPEIPDPEACIPVNEVAPMLRMYDQFNIRFDPKSTGWNDGKFNEISELNAWMSFVDDSKFDIYTLLMIPDMLPPAVFNRVGPSGWVPTIEMMVNVRAIPDTNRVQVRARTKYLTDGILEEDVEIWDENGKLLAIARQIAKLRMK